MDDSSAFCKHNQIYRHTIRNRAREVTILAVVGTAVVTSMAKPAFGTVKKQRQKSLKTFLISVSTLLLVLDLSSKELQKSPNFWSHKNTPSSQIVHQILCGGTWSTKRISERYNKYKKKVCICSKECCRSFKIRVY